MFNYGDDSPSAPVVSGDALARAGVMARRQKRAQDRVAAAEKELKAAEEELRVICEEQFPELLASVGLDSLRTSEGLEVVAREKVFAAISAEHAEPAFKWLEDNNHSALIKRQFVIEFGRAEETWANKFEADLRKRKHQLNVKRKKSVHPQTLAAFVRESLAEGVDLPQDTFGVYVRKVTEIKETK